MKSFKEFCLAEGIIRTGAIGAYAAGSKRHGATAVQAYREAQRQLRVQRSAATADQRLTQIAAALRSLLDGLIAQREQIGAGVAVDVVGHSLAVKEKATT